MLAERMFGVARAEGRTGYVWSPAVEEWTLEIYGYSPLGEGAVMLHGKTSADRARKQVESWVVRPKEAASQVKAKGERVEIRALEQGVVRACLSPNTPVDAARVAKGEVALSGEGERPGFKLVVLWLDERGDKVGTTTLANARQGALTDEINTPLTPPAGAVEAQLCASVEGAGLTATLTRLELTRGAWNPRPWPAPWLDAAAAAPGLAAPCLTRSPAAWTRYAPSGPRSGCPRRT